MTDDVPNPLQLATMEELVDEIMRRASSAVINISYPDPDPQPEGSELSVYRSWGMSHEKSGLVRQLELLIEAEMKENLGLLPQVFLDDDDDEGEEWKHG